MVSNTLEVKQYNKEKIREVIRRSERFTKGSISNETGLSIGTCSSILNEMEAELEILKDNVGVRQIGRPVAEYTYNADFHHILACCIVCDTSPNNDISVEFTITNAIGECLKHEVLVNNELDYDFLESSIGIFISGDNTVNAIGIGLPGVVTDGIVTNCDIETLNHVALCSQLQDKFGIPVLADNDANFMAYSIYDSSSADGGSIAAIYLPSYGNGTVGCGIVHNGRVLKGDTKFAGELMYIAEIFGIPRAEQRQMYTNKSTIVPFVVKMAMTLICTIGPSRIYIMNKDITPEDISLVNEGCAKIISAENLPVIKAQSNIINCYLDGIVAFTLNHLHFKFV